MVRKDTYQCLCTSLCHSLSLSENTFIRTCPHTVGTERDGSLDIVCKLADVSVSCTGLLKGECMPEPAEKPPLHLLGPGRASVCKQVKQYEIPLCRKVTVCDWYDLLVGN